MKAWYVMIHFDGPYVSGFVVPKAVDEKDALRQLRLVLQTRIKVVKALGYDKYPGSDDSPQKLIDFLRSIKRPWRFAGGNRRNNEKKAVPDNIRQGNKVVRVVEMTKPLHAGYWLKDILQGKELCNIH